MAFIRKNMGDNFLSVVGIVGTWLWTAILQYKINQWLRSKGGWVRSHQFVFVRGWGGNPRGFSIAQRRGAAPCYFEELWSL